MRHREIGTMGAQNQTRPCTSDPGSTRLAPIDLNFIPEIDQDSNPTHGSHAQEATCGRILPSFTSCPFGQMVDTAFRAHR